MHMRHGPPAHSREAHEAAREMLGIDKESVALDLIHAMHRITNRLENASNEYLREHNLSNARLGLLMRLAICKRLGHDDGLSPTALSKYRRVSKNTVSALLRGLEDQGYIERQLDPDDRRRFHIRITVAGRELVEAIAPGHAVFMQEILSALDAEEQTTLLALLHKLIERLAPMARCGKHEIGKAEHELTPATKE